MRLAEKRDDMTDEISPDSATPTGPADDCGVPPAASLTAGLIQRGRDGWRRANSEPTEHRAATAAPEEPVVGARAQQAVLEEAFPAREPVAAIAAIDRSDFQSVREAAAEWHLFRAPAAGFWDRLMRDVSIFTIFFAVLVFVILQIM